MSFNTKRKEEINWITSAATKLYREDFGSMSECLSKATRKWKDDKKIRERLVLNKVFQEVSRD